MIGAMLKGFTHARLACGCRITFREGVEGSPVTVVVDQKSSACTLPLHVRDLPVYDYREALRPSTRSGPAGRRRVRRRRLKAQRRAGRVISEAGAVLSRDNHSQPSAGDLSRLRIDATRLRAGAGSCGSSWWCSRRRRVVYPRARTYLAERRAPGGRRRRAPRRS
jgi:hypothetical protein